MTQHQIPNPGTVHAPDPLDELQQIFSGQIAVEGEPPVYWIKREALKDKILKKDAVTAEDVHAYFKRLIKVEPVMPENAAAGPYLFGIRAEEAEKTEVAEKIGRTDIENFGVAKGLFRIFGDAEISQQTIGGIAHYVIPIESFPRAAEVKSMVITPNEYKWAIDAHIPHSIPRTHLIIEPGTTVPLAIAIPKEAADEIHRQPAGLDQIAPATLRMELLSAYLREQVSNPVIGDEFR